MALGLLIEYGIGWFGLGTSVFLNLLDWSGPACQSWDCLIWSGNVCVVESA